MAVGCAESAQLRKKSLSREIMMLRLHLLSCVLLFPGIALADNCLSGAELAGEIIAGQVEAYPFQNGLAYDLPEGKTCYVSKNDKSADVVAYLTEPARHKNVTDVAGSLAGTWLNSDLADASLAIKVNAEVLSIEGGSVFNSSGGSQAVADFIGNVPVNAYPLKIESSEVDGCYLQILPVGKLLVIFDSGEVLGQCGGYGATFSGIYRRKG